MGQMTEFSEATGQRQHGAGTSATVPLGATSDRSGPTFPVL